MKQPVKPKKPKADKLPTLKVGNFYFKQGKNGVYVIPMIIGA